jgi:hypothetical protein
MFYNIGPERHLTEWSVIVYLLFWRSGCSTYTNYIVLYVILWTATLPAVILLSGILHNVILMNVILPSIVKLRAILPIVIPQKSLYLILFW